MSKPDQETIVPVAGDVMDPSSWSSYAERIGSVPGGAAGREAGIDWDAVHAAVQDQLSHLTGRVLAQCPGVEWRAGRASARAFSLFSYRVFEHLDGDDYDPILVGLIGAECGPAVRITGDISGEESGHIYFDEDCEQIVPASTDRVIAAASELAGLLAAHDQLVIGAIRQRHPEAIRD